ncbi:aminoglycoside 6'-N-acetyltransferase [Pacificibacter maritimus]|uniref:Aminoglycoside 6'-N-acetyltransferase n=1 Tax=Pacificibacter maritimus TaxID=762213 RepID=A0A3N4U6G7_9RHOB|nr:GNAT family N-acetyltransferase [Pacificibacter maritimus]RPE66366.1 aminoglycoside 6'-N-acetyltransferase [Pacificibacter maritimus]
MADYSFRPITRDDLPMFKAWVDQPHMGGWWGDSGTEARLVQEDMGKGVVDMRIVEHGGTPIAYIQDYNAHAFDAPQYADLPKDTRAVDTFLGDPAFLGQGHAKAYLRARCDILLDHYPMVAVDPDPKNTRAIRAYAAAGFGERRLCACEDGDPVLVLTRHH